MSEKTCKWKLTDIFESEDCCSPKIWHEIECRINHDDHMIYGSLDHNEYKYCPYCAGKIVEVKDGE